VNRDDVPEHFARNDRLRKTVRVAQFAAGVVLLGSSPSLMPVSTGYSCERETCGFGLGVDYHKEHQVSQLKELKGRMTND